MGDIVLATATTRVHKEMEGEVFFRRERLGS